MNALIYCRVSSEKQIREGNGLGSQEQRCRVYATQKGYTVIEIFPDEGVSGGLFKRPAMKSLIGYLDAHPLEKFVIIFDDLSRFARDVQVHIQLKAELVSRGAKLECLNFNFDDSDESEMAELMLAVSNQYQRKANRRQVIQKQKARLEKGYWAFMPPTALSNQKDPMHGKILTPVEPHATIFKQAIEKFGEGTLFTQYDVQKYIWQEYKVRNLSKRPSLSTVGEILKNPLYAGYLEFEDWGVSFRKAQHEGFVSLDTYNHVQRRLEGRRKPWNKHDYSKDFPLRSHIVCTGCGHLMTASWNKGRNARYPNYFCHTRKCKYQWKVVAKDKMESQFETVLSVVTPFEEYIDLARDILAEQWSFRLEQQVLHRNVLKNEEQEVDQMTKTYLMRLGKTDDEEVAQMYEQEIKGLTQKKKEINAEVTKEIFTHERFGTALDKVFSVLKQPLNMWKSSEYEDQKAVLQMYFPDLLKYDYYEGFGTVSLAYPIKLISDLGQAENGSVEMSKYDLESESKNIKTSTSVVDTYCLVFLLILSTRERKT